MTVERRRRRALIVAASILALLALDFVRAPERQISARILVGSIHVYQRTLSNKMPLLGVRCRFKPTCSHYGEGAIRKYGTVIGTIKTGWRILRCGPWTPAGTVDPP